MRLNVSFYCLLLGHLAILRADYPYCFRFTWVGPFLDKKNIVGLTCEDLHEGLTTIPCRRPLVATVNDTIPDTVDLWRKYEKDPNGFGCPMTPGQACVKYTYIYNKGVQNITYMCAKVNATEGCYRQKSISGSEVEVCVCNSRLGEMPCNYAASIYYIHNNISSHLVNLLMATVICLINKLR